MSTDIESTNIHKSCTVGQLVAERPNRANVFDEYGIDYCCGGKLTLEEACRRKGLRLNEVIEKLQNNNNEIFIEKDWTRSSLKDLIDHIVFHYHRPLQNQFPRVLQLAEKVSKAHSSNHPEMVEVFQILQTFCSQLELHMHKEEMVLFPAIASMESGNGKISFGCGGGLEMPISVMSQEHDDAGEALGVLQSLTNNFTPPEDACNSFRVLLHALAEINSEMKQHVHKENNILFPRALNLVQNGTCSSSH
jgi:regulator of cell morphogenesis and NO signaling